MVLKKTLDSDETVSTATNTLQGPSKRMTFLKLLLLGTEDTIYMAHRKVNSLKHLENGEFFLRHPLKIAQKGLSL